MESILKTVRAAMSLEQDCPDFDNELIPLINATFNILYQMGVGKDPNFFIESETETWKDFLEDEAPFKMVEAYVSTKVLVQFDPPQSSSVLKNKEEMINEYEWRLYHAGELLRISKEENDNV